MWSLHVILLHLNFSLTYMKPKNIVEKHVAASCYIHGHVYSYLFTCIDVSFILLGLCISYLCHILYASYPIFLPWINAMWKQPLVTTETINIEIFFQNWFGRIWPRYQNHHNLVSLASVQLLFLCATLCRMLTDENENVC